MWPLTCLGGLVSQLEHERYENFTSGFSLEKLLQRHNIRLNSNKENCGQFKKTDSTVAELKS